MKFIWKEGESRNRGEERGETMAQQVDGYFHQVFLFTSGYKQE